MKKKPVKASAVVPDKGPKLPKKKAVATGSVLGAIALITGSTVGAGMLALPEATAGGGFIPSAGIMIVSWLILTSEALLLAEVNLSVKEKRRKETGEDPDTVITLKEMAEKTVGPVGAKLTSGLYLFLANTLLVAYISKGGELLDLLSNHSMPASIASLVFTLGLGGLLWKGSEKTIDTTNRVFTSLLLFLFGGLLLGGSQFAHFGTLLQQQDWTQEWGALPVVFLALVYHDLVPVLCKQLGWDKRKIRTSLVCGSLVPLSLFLAWDAVALALVPGAVNVIEAGGAIDPIRVLIETQGDLAGSAIAMFSLLAVATSFIGTTLGLSEYMKAETSKLFKGSNKTAVKEQGAQVDEKLMAMMLTLAPPTFAAFSSPNLFFAATRIAGGYGMTLLYGVLPPIMAWYLRHPAEDASCAKKRELVPGGRPVLASLTSFAASVEIGKLLTDLKAFIATISMSGVPVTAAVNVVVSDLASSDVTHGVADKLHL